jgi:hypothetical protein
MKTRIGIIVVAGALLGCASLEASYTQYTLYLPSNTPTGNYPGPYTAALETLGGPDTGNNIQLFCDDAADSAIVGSNWTVYSTVLSAIYTGSNASLDNTRYGADTTGPGDASVFSGASLTPPTGTQLYEELAWLFTQLAEAPVCANPCQPGTIAQGLQDAAWDLTSSNGPQNDNTDAVIWLKAAAADYNKTSGISAVSVDSTSVSIYVPNYADWNVATPPGAVGLNSGGGTQEFLYFSTGSNYYNGPTPTPEPGTIGLLGGGLLVLGLLRRRGTKRQVA